MISLGKINHDPLQLCKALERASVAFIDTETTGLGRNDQVLSVGVRIDGINHIIFSNRCCEAGIRALAVSDDEIRVALEPLARPDLVTVGHNITPFDTGMLAKLGVTFLGEIRDTLLMLRLADQDRGKDKDHAPRYHLRADEEPVALNYRLKDVGRQLCGIKPLYTPETPMLFVSYRKHATYLAHDLAVTEAVYRKVWPLLDWPLRQYYRRFILPVMRMVEKINAVGVPADVQFIHNESGRLTELMDTLSDEHRRETGIELSGLLDWPLRKLIYRTYGLPVISGPQWKGSVDQDTIARLAKATINPHIERSLRLIADFRKAKELRNKLRSFLNYVDGGRIYSQFKMQQSGGRISSTDPNLQGITKTKVIAERTFKCRNFLAAPPGRVLVGADLSQADVRVLAHQIADCRVRTSDLKDALLTDRMRRLGDKIGPFMLMSQYFNERYRGQSPEPPPEFIPGRYSRLVDDFRTATGDFYCAVGNSITGEKIDRSDPRYDIFKRMLLGLINGMTTAGLAKNLRLTPSEAKRYVADFDKAYPEIKTYLGHLKLQVAISGQVFTWAGRPRTMRAHRWMVSEPRVRMLLTYRDGNKYWLDAVPLVPTLRFLTCYLRRIWSVANSKKPVLIYDHERGRLGKKHYKQIDSTSLYRLPLRNVPWSNIRRVQRLNEAGQPVEEARYEGLDTTARVAINAVMQGGTAAITSKAMLRMKHYARVLGAPLISQVHDEVLFECPAEKQGFILRLIKKQLERPPVAGFAVPIKVKLKWGQRYGDMTEGAEPPEEQPT